MTYILYVSLFLYGFFYHISSSEFWPITVSKTWFNSQPFERSMLQKPLLTFFLSLFHFLPLNDTLHLYLVKIIFTAVGLFSLIFYVRFLKRKLSHPDLASPALILLVVVLISPSLLNNFFNIRTDQLAFLLFTVFWYFTDEKKTYPALISLACLPLLGIKEIIFVLPGLLLFYCAFKFRLSKKMWAYVVAGLAGVFIWVVALNIASISYVIENFQNSRFPNAQLKDYLNFEALLLVGSLLSSLFWIYTKKFQSVALISLYFTVLLFALPQSYSFYISSLLGFIYLPLFLILLTYYKNHKSKVTVFLVIQMVCVGINWKSKNFDVYNSNKSQFSFIKKTSRLLKENNFTYLDGMGVFPKQSFIPCFVSPDDDSSNSNCLGHLEQATADVVIITGRLSYLGLAVPKSAEKSYSQIRPNVWVKNTKLTENINRLQDLANEPLPILIF